MTPTMSAADALAVSTCRNCGGASLSWEVCTRNASEVVEGRLRTGDVESICVLGCDECSETLFVCPARTAFAALVALVAENEALRSALGEIVDVAEGYMSFDENSRFGIAIAQANEALTPSEPAP